MPNSRYPLSFQGFEMVLEVAELQKQKQQFGRPGYAGQTGQFGHVGQSREQGMTRLFMTVGRKDKIQTNEILRTIAEETGIPGKRVGKIDIMDNFTFVEVPSDIVEKVITAMNNAVIKGKKVAVAKAKPQASASKSREKKKYK